MGEVRFTHIPVQQINRSGTLLCCDKPQAPAFNNERERSFKDECQHKYHTEDNNEGGAVGITKKLCNLLQVTLNGGAHSEVHNRQHCSYPQHLEKRHYKKAHHVKDQ